MELRNHFQSGPTLLWFFIFQLGGNDAAYIKSEDKYVVTPERFAENVNFLLDAVPQFDGIAIVQGVLPVNEDVTLLGNRSKSNKQVEIFNEVLAKVTKKHNVHMLDVYSAFMKEYYKDLLCNDGVHPNEKGHLLLYKMMSGALKLGQSLF